MLGPPPNQVQWVGYGRAGAEALRATIAEAKGDEPLAPVTVIVPSNHIGVATRRLLASGVLGPVCGRGAGLVAVSFVTPYRLAELLGAPRLAGAGRRPVSTPLIAAALRASLAAEPGLFAPVAAHPATETALIDAYREVRDLPDAALDAVGAASGLAGEVVRLCRAARARLAPAWYDEQDLSAAAVAAAEFGAGRVAALGTVVLYLPQRLSLHSARLIAAVSGAQSGVAVLAGTTGDDRADAEVIVSVERLGAALGPSPGPLSGGGGKGGTHRSGAAEPTVRSPDGGVVAPGRTRVLSTSDADDEVRAAVRAVVDAARAGIPLDRVAILHASPVPYARLVHEQLTAAGIAANGASVIPVAARVAGRALLGLLALPEGGFRRQEVFTWLAGAPVRHAGRWAPVTAWERLSRQAGVVAGRDQWDRLLVRVAEESDQQQAEAESDPDALEWRADSHRVRAERARSLREFVIGLIDDLAGAAAAPAGWGERAAWARGLLDGLLGGADRRRRWPAAEVRAAERVERAIDRLAALDAVEGPVGLDVFTRTLRLELDTDLGRVGRFGEGVLVGSVGMGTGLDLDLVVILGLAEGSFPTSVHDDSLLPDHDRRAAGGLLPLRSDRVEREHRELLAALAGATRQLLCVPRGDLRQSRDQVPSRWVLQLAGELAQLGGRRTRVEEAESVEEVASFAAGLRHLTFPATAQEYRLRALLATGSNRLDPASLAVVADERLAAGAAVAAARRSGAFTRFDGNLAGLAIPSPADQTTSATRLEGWSDCPFAYLLKEILRVEEVERPEDNLTLTPIDRGSLVHEALERFVADALGRPLAEQPQPGEAWSAADTARMIDIANDVCDRYHARGVTGRPIFWRRERKGILLDLRRFLAADSAWRQAHGARPVAAELAFGMTDGGPGAVRLPLPDGRSVSFRGKADRIDLAADGTLSVVDYKTGRPDGFRDLSEDNPDLQGRKLQLAVYGVAARSALRAPHAPVRSEYWFISTRGRFQRIGYMVSSDVLERVSQTLGTVVAGIEAGTFPHHPTATPSPWVGCAACDPDGLGVAELRRAWDRKRGDGALALFSDLAEPMATIEAVLEEIPGV